MSKKTKLYDVGFVCSMVERGGTEMMQDQQYNELRKAYTKEVLANLIKADIRQRFPEPYASMYCQQFEDFKNVADFFEYAAKMMRR